ncbi:uncharacterized protein LOC135369671 isoform X2 [Ornithodoros turicata]|uniref:uncharacterized protein LOC135369671 isoform X2 n=1 Tax=Ornithodoros turicata TaxID=34597 RepID=UPI0031399317
MTSVVTDCLCDAADANHKEDVYARLRKLRQELAELRLHTGHDYYKKLAELEAECCDKDREIEALKECCERFRNEIVALLEMVHNNNDEKLATGADCIPLRDLPPAAGASHIRLRLRALERRAEGAEEQVHNMCLQLSRKTIELNKLQLLYSNQTLRLVELSRSHSTQATSGVYSGRSSMSCPPSALSPKLNAYASSDNLDHR